jgi:dTDP-4-dehydrorhamnose reductase
MILLTGGSGLLGTELIKLLGKKDCIWAPTHKEFDILKAKRVSHEINLIVHCAAYTDVARAETSRKTCFDVNVIGTRNLVNTGIPMIYISTEYVFDGDKGNYKENDIPGPKNFYALTKLLGEFEAHRSTGVIIRTCFKPRPFEHAAACVDQYTSGDYVDVIAKEVALVIKNWHKIPSIIHIGTKRKSVYALARKTRDVIPITVKTIGVQLPRDTSLDVSLWQKIRRGL